MGCGSAIHIYYLDYLLFELNRDQTTDLTIMNSTSVVSRSGTSTVKVICNLSSKHGITRIFVVDYIEWESKHTKASKIHNF